MSDVFLRTYGPNTWKSGHAQTTSNTPTPPGKWGYLRGFDPSVRRSNYFRTDDSLPDKSGICKSCCIWERALI